MAAINLLPWREELRKKRQQDFVMSIIAVTVIACFMMVLVYMQIEGMKEYQRRRNQLVQNEIQVVDGKIGEIRDIESKKNQLLTKIEVIQKLQESRPEIVHLFDELAKSTPEGVFLTKFKQTGQDLILTGKAQSNARVSAYMRAVEASSWLEDPVLQVIKSKSSEGEMNDFSMSARQGSERQIGEKE